MLLDLILLFKINWQLKLNWIIHKFFVLSDIMLLLMYVYLI